ncbi:MAG TPA: hypothetical protein VL358_04530 [Caulobacteraceae bacterium]|jgi:hypothetical protein|nr:hypothetical protein [Caulobacteraceae bacterium]
MRLFRNLAGYALAAMLAFAPVLAATPAAAAITYSTAIANARLDAVESTCGASAILRVRTGSPPATVATASSGTVLATMSLPSDWMAAASSRAKSKSGTWEDTSADNTGTAGHFEIVASDTTTVCMRGTVTATGGGGDLTLDNTSIASGQDVLINTFTINAAN